MELTIRQRLKWGAIAFSAMALLYMAIGYGIVGTVPVTLLTKLDTIIPFIPEFIWVYLSYIPLLAVGFLLSSTKEKFSSTTATLMLATLVAFVIYIIFPATYPRPDIVGEGLSLLAIKITYIIDPAVNVFPSLHVALSWVIAKTFKENKLFILWAFAISISTLFVKQHFVLDVFAGYLLAEISVKAIEMGKTIYKKIRK